MIGFLVIAPNIENDSFKQQQILEQIYAMREIKRERERENGGGG